MKARAKSWGLALAALLLTATAAQADPLTFSFSLLPPDGAVAGAAGSTVGWGYSIANESDTNWLMLTAFNPPLFDNAAVDASLFDFPILAPGAVLTVPYDPIALAGLLQITWDVTAPLGFINSGLFVLSGEFWSGDPLLDGLFVALAPDRSALFSASVTEPPPPPVPEPATLLLMGTGVGALWVRRRKLQRS